MVNPRVAYTEVALSDVAGGDEGDEEQVRLGTGQEVGATTRTLLPRALRLALIFALWYGTNITFNLSLKRACNAVDAHMTVATLQLVLGLAGAWLLVVAGVRRPPPLDPAVLRALSLAGFANALAHIGGVVAIGAGAVSFAHIVKACEPVFTAVLVARLTNESLSWRGNLALMPIVCGVWLTCASEIDFVWAALVGGMVSNLGCSLRTVLCKQILSSDSLKVPLDPAAVYFIITLLSVPWCAGAALFFEGPQGLRSVVVAASAPSSSLWTDLLVSGVMLYAFNDLALVVLHMVHSVTYAVANNLKRLAVVLVSVVVFGNPITPLGWVGCFVAIGGTLVYSLVKDVR